MKDRVWLGLGHCIDYASSLQAGFIGGKLRMGYVYEYPVVRSYLLPGGAHEFCLVLNLFRPNERRNDNEVLI